MADTPNDDNNNPLSGKPSDHGYRPLKYLDESLFPSNNGDFASSFMQPHGSANRLHNPPPAADPSPWKDPDQDWRYIDERVWTGEAFVVSHRTQPDNRTERSNMQASSAFSAAVVPQDHRQSQAPGGSHGFGGLGFTGPAQAPGVFMDRGADPSFQNLVGASSRGSQVSAALARDTLKNSSPINKVQFVFTGWNDDAKRELFMWKVKRKKGYAFFLHLFPGETTESLHEAFKQYRNDGERLYNG
ncbi:hypothetical protein G6011_09025 [Alternaria panax]|uniref:Uncharacterized protein n=1 Tax=Alternaria panax TaxID=48097 RepID=A0AAD4IAJ3_9PLEO|nr:hypothetical protein G6011_09025 [Alternaria panax]